MDWRWLVWHWSIAVAVRLVLLLLGVGEAMIWRPEISTPANTVLKTREGLHLMQLGITPYQGSSCHTPPLWMAVAAPLVKHDILYAVPNMLCDLAAAAALLLASASVYGPSKHSSSKRDAPWLSPEQLSLMYLLNPFTVLTCVAGATTSAENMAVIMAVCGGLMRNGPLAAAGVAVGAYMGLHPILLALPLMLLMWRGPEDLLQSVPPAPKLLISSATGGGSSSSSAAEDADAAAESTAADVGGDAAAAAPTPIGRGKLQRRSVAAGGHQKDAAAGSTDAAAKGQQLAQQQHRAGAAAGASRQAVVYSSTSCWIFMAVLVSCGAALLVLSDSMLQQHPEAQCLPALLQLAQQIASVGWKHADMEQLSSCWAVRVYKFSLLLEDYTPTIGLWWYFFTEMFEAFRAFFVFVFHSYAVILVVPMAIRFYNRPFLVAWVQLLISCMFKPYACAGDMVPWMSLLPLLQQQLQCIKMGMFFVNSLLLIIVLGPAMWNQWIIVDAANANFFYSITLLLGVWYTVFLVQMLKYTALLDYRLAGKRPAGVQGKLKGE